MSPKSLAQATAASIASPTDLRMGTVVAVTSRGIDVSVTEGIVPGCAHLASCNPAVGDPVALLKLRDSWLVLDRPVGPGTATDLATPGSGIGATLLGGTVLSGTNTTMASSTGSLVAVPRYRCTYYHPPGHQVLIMLGVTWYCSVANDTLGISLWDAVTGLQAAGLFLIQAGNNLFSHFESAGIMLPPDAYGGRRVDLYMQLSRVNGTGTSRVDDAVGNRGYMTALDMGASVIATV